MLRHDGELYQKFDGVFGGESPQAKSGAKLAASRLRHPCSDHQAWPTRMSFNLRVRYPEVAVLDRTS